MGTIKRFEDLEIWLLARELLNLVYDNFRNCRDYNFMDQITSASLSIKNNVTEGFSRDNDKELRLLFS
jgi:four helix bundle protein